MGVIYGLHTKDGPIRYVGQTVQPLRRRLARHRDAALHYSKRTPVRDWIGAVGIENVEMVVLEECAAADLNAAERKWIAKLREAEATTQISVVDRPPLISGVSLLNLLDGGDGRPDWIPSDLHRLAVSDALTGIRRSEETRERMRAAARAAWRVRWAQDREASEARWAAWHETKRR